MTITPRRYTGLDDLKHMENILIEGRKASPYSGYVHVGDLNWWAFYILKDYDFREVAYLWEDESGKTLGWSLLSPNYGAYDVFVHPTIRGTESHAEMLAWTEARMLETLKQGGEHEIQTMWAFNDDAWYRNWLEGCGYQRVTSYLLHYTTCSLDAIPEPKLPDGFRFHTVTKDDVEARSAVHRAAFQSKRMTAESYAHFMTAPGYRAELDIVAAAPDGRFAAYAMGWFDSENGFGYFEPVGTSPDFQKMGLGKATLLEGMRRMKALGAHTASVCHDDDNPASTALYRSVGFRTANTIHAYSKGI